MPHHEDDDLAVDTSTALREQREGLTTRTTGRKWDGLGGYITTFTGIQFMLANPTEDMISLDDIAHALSMICHFGGHTAQFFSVAQHSVLVARAARIVSSGEEEPFDPKFRRLFCQWALMHDAAEAYIGDVTRPLKVLLPDYRLIENRISLAVAKRFGMTTLPEEIYARLKRVDDSILKLEAKMLMNRAVLHDGRGNPYDLDDPPEGLPQNFISPMNHQVAKAAFLREFAVIFEDDDGL